MDNLEHQRGLGYEQQVRKLERAYDLCKNIHGSKHRLTFTLILDPTYRSSMTLRLSVLYTSNP